ncbi:hypothetical protein A7U60_g1115 [Sanghuangporus baumii]|uniref:DUF6534 domain-containing protein n=1 Tax=Sanghuangporus baumii TaxID=108892 RepID=A0A9Q5I4I0_SANBA|nr:hypothetical protein A7U60_g1115 [Sanghuangporus baumii]
MASSGAISASQVDSTFGCLFIAVILTSALWGVGCLQFYLYCEKYWKTERRWLKVYMSLLWILDTVNQAFISNDTYVLFVKGIANPALLARNSKSGSATSILTAFIDAMVQAIFIQRAWYLSDKNRILAGVSSAAVLVQFALTMTFFGRIVGVTDITLIAKSIPIELASAVVGALTDTFLAVTLVWLLRKGRSGFRRSDSIVNRLVTYTVGSGLVTAICALFALISAAVAPHSFVYMLAGLLTSKLYFNCLLASLNARSSLRAAANQESGGLSIHLENSSSSIAGESNHSASDLNKASISKAIECRVNIDIETGTDRTTVNSSVYAALGIPTNIDESCGVSDAFSSICIARFWKTEKRWIKTYMVVLWIVDTVHQALISNTAYMCLVKGIADPAWLSRYQKITPGIAALTAFIDAMVQIIFIRRAWYLSSEGRVLTGALSAAVLIQFALTLGYSIITASISESIPPGYAIPLQLTAAAFVVFTDTFLAVVQVWLLRKARSGFRRSDSIVKRLVTYIIGSSLVTTICPLVALVSATVAPNSSIFELAGYLLSKLYFNCLFASLNARSSLRAAANQESGDLSIHFENSSSSSPGDINRSASDSNKAPIPKAIECRVNIDIETGTDRMTVNSSVYAALGISANIDECYQLS